ncbi:MAG TPA: sugar nucleotide-binding protein [Candidatus Thermoplasmatota archaeon]|nr:sugar nucleotide-binding protein [Candidatus Thermoplasmatota archaeon]
MAETLLFGGSGRLGTELRQHLKDCVAPPRAEVDVTRPETIEAALAHHRPSVVVHAAGWVDVRGCETDRPRAWRMNVEGTQNVVRALRDRPDTRLVYVSTACVFRGDRGDYTEDDVPYPANFYGVTKLVGEQLARTHPRTFIVRTDFVARKPWPYPGAFVDRYSTSVFAPELAEKLGELVNRGSEGLLHLCGRDKVSHYDLARIVSPDVKPISLKDVDLPLPRDQSLRSTRGGDVLMLRRT